MRLVLLGPPGSGKGTQAVQLQQQLHVPHISTGDLLRAEVAAKSSLGIVAKEVMARGELVSDTILLDMLNARLNQSDAHAGFILDGYPRNLSQAKALDLRLEASSQPLDVAVQLNVPMEILVERIAGRAQAQGREDDHPDSVRLRLRVYQDVTAPVIDFYREQKKLIVIDGIGSLDAILQRILTALSTQTGR